MAAKDDELQRILVSLLHAICHACTLCAFIPDSTPERAELNAARAALGRVVLAYCKRTGRDMKVFERALTDDGLGGEALFLSLLDTSDAVRELLNKEPSTELIRIQAASLVRKVVRVARDWCRFNNLSPTEVDSRLSSTAFANK